jgi:flagellar hook-length control protein FliK
MVESVSDQFMPVSSGPQNVEEPEVSENTKQTMTDKGASSVEQQPRMSQMPGIAMPANGPMNEPPAANPGGNIPSKQLQAGVAEIVQQMVHHIKPSLKNRPASMRMQLNPSDLGAIDVQLVSNARGYM